MFVFVAPSACKLFLPTRGRSAHNHPNSRLFGFMFLNSLFGSAAQHVSFSSKYSKPVPRRENESGVKKVKEGRV